MADLFVNTAVLHIFDYTSGISVLSQQSLNLEDKMIESYVSKHVQRIMNDIRLKNGYFNEGSRFLSLAQEYKDKRLNFVDFSQEAANTFAGYLKNTASQSYDVLFADYRYDEVPYVAMMLLENQRAYTHLTGNTNGIIGNSIIQHHSILPSPTKKLNSFAIVNTLNLDVRYVDNTNWNNGDIQVMQELILDCTSERSREEVLADIHDVVTEVAIKTDVNPTLLLSKYKNYMKTSAEADNTVTTEDLAVHVFNETDDMQNVFISASVEHELPKEVEVPKAVTARKMKNQKIKTDTGIELTFPTEYFENPNIIEFINNPDGTISIEIKHIGSIENKG